MHDKILLWLVNLINQPYTLVIFAESYAIALTKICLEASIIIQFKAKTKNSLGKQWCKDQSCWVSWCLGYEESSCLSIYYSCLPYRQDLFSIKSCPSNFESRTQWGMTLWTPASDLGGWNFHCLLSSPESGCQKHHFLSFLCLTPFILFSYFHERLFWAGVPLEGEYFVCMPLCLCACMNYH